MDAALLAQLERARRLGFLGPGPVEEHVAHAAVFVDALADVGGCVADLGSGGGVPGLVLAVARPDLEVLLVDSMERRCAFLEEALAALAAASARVVHTRAELLGRTPLRGSLDAVVARGFGPPAATAECGAPLLLPGGLLVVSEPPGAPPRWPDDGLAILGLGRGPRSASQPAVQVLVQLGPCPDRYPRRVGVPAKRPLF
jgi:16S rRNA (guanine527-N7)-methyltransferase